MVMLLKYWKFAAYGAVIAALFTAGWQTNGWRLESAWEHEKAERAKAVAEAVIERNNHWRAVQAAQRAKTKFISDALTATLDSIRIRNEEMSTRLSTASLIKPEVITLCEINDNEIVNPIGNDFVALWRVRLDD